MSAVFFVIFHFVGNVLASLFFAVLAFLIVDGLIASIYCRRDTQAHRLLQASEQRRKRRDLHGRVTP